MALRTPAGEQLLEVSAGGETAAAGRPEPSAGSKRIEAAVILLIGLSFFALLCSTHDIPNGYDAYRHVKVASLLMEQPQAVMQDPWRLALLWPKPVDVWFGYELLLAPLTRVFGLLVAAKVLASLIFAGIAFVILRLLDYFQAAHRLLWLVIALAGSSVTLSRAATCRPFLLSVLLVLTAALLTLRDKPWGVAAVSALHALSYSIFFLVAAAPGLWLLLRRDRRAVRLAFASAAGMAAGLLLNPYFPQNLRFDLVCTVVVNIAKHAHVSIGGELFPIDPVWGFATSLPVLAAWIAAVVVRVRRWPKHGIEPAADLLLGISAAALIGSLQVQRTFDFFVPFGTLFAAAVLSGWLARRTRDLPYLAALVLVVCGAHVFLTYRNAQATIPVDRYRNVSDFLRTHAPGELILDSQWGDYHYLFYWNAVNRYFIGIEPTFTYLGDARQYWIWRHLSDDEPVTCAQEVCTSANRLDPVDAVARQLHARYILTDHQFDPRLEAMLHARRDVVEIYRDADFSVSRIDLAGAADQPVRR